MYSILLHLLLLSIACCRSSKAPTHAQQQQVYLQGTQQLSVTVRARKINFSPNDLNEKEILPASSAPVHEHALNLANNAENEHNNNNRLSQPNKTKLITTTSEPANRANYRQSRIFVKETFNDAPLKLPYGFRPAAAPRYPLQYPHAEKSMSQKQAQSITERKTQMIRSNEDWTPIAYVLEPFDAESREAQSEMSSTIRSLRRSSSTHEPIRETVIYGAQRSIDQSFLANVYDEHLFQSGNARKPDNVITRNGNSAALGGLEQQHKLNERIKQRKGIAANEKMHSKYQATDNDWKENSTNKPEEKITLHIEEIENKKSVKDIEMANMNNHSTVTMKISLRRAMKNSSTKSDNSSSSSSAGSIAGHGKPIMMSTHAIPFKSNETTWPLNAIEYPTTSEEAASTLSLSSSSSSSSSFSATTLSSLSTSTSFTTELSTSASASISSSSSLYSSKAASSSTLAKSSASSSIPLLISTTSSTANPITTTSNNLTTAEPKTCVPMIVRENSFTNPAEIIELERIVCFPLPPDAELNFDELLKEPEEVIKLEVKDRNVHEDFWNSRMNSKSSNFDKNMVLLYLSIAFWFL